MSLWTQIGYGAAVALVAFGGFGIPALAHLRSRRLDRVLGIDPPADQPGDVLTSIPAVEPPARPMHREQRDAFDAIVAANPGLAAVDVLALSDLYLLPEESA